MNQKTAAAKVTKTGKDEEMNLPKLSDLDCKEIADAINHCLAPKGLFCWGWQFSLTPGARQIKFKCKIGNPDAIEELEIPAFLPVEGDLWQTRNP
ncbi:MAG: hypothetical protein GXY54_04430 [Deltaproteobacteria bacterium]|nr:hypothetical protein [Deltaproteobacteria bacterium]